MWNCHHRRRQLFTCLIAIWDLKSSNVLNNIHHCAFVLRKTFRFRALLTFTGAMSVTLPDADVQSTGPLTVTNCCVR